MPLVVIVPLFMGFDRVFLATPTTDFADIACFTISVPA
jgi:hypothetical protein